MSTSQTLSLSALGCFSILITFETKNFSKSKDVLSTLSTSNPISVSFFISWFSEFFV